MLRRSARLQHTHEEPQTATDSKQNEAPRGRKRARTASSSTETPARSAPRRRIAGFLERFAKEAPLDVCLEVFKYLQPRDLLHLARTSKALRGFLMSNSSQLIWRTARENVPDLPPLPPDLNEPQYASLLFDTFCYVCLRAPCHHVVWSCRFRCCIKCVPTAFITSFHLLKEAQDMVYKYGCTELMPYCSTRKFGVGFLPSTINQFFREYLEVKDDAEKLDEWESRKQRESEATAIHSDQCQEWYSNLLKARGRELRDAREQRTNEIIRRLKDIGWEDDYLNAEFRGLPSVRQSKALTDRIWANIKPGLIEYLEEKKTKKLECDRKLAFVKRHRMLGRLYRLFCDKSADVHPSIGDVILHPKSKRIHDLIWDTPWEQELSEADLMEVLNADIPDIKADWIEKNESALLAQMPAGSTPSQLRSIKTIFRCAACREHLWVPRIYAHRCSTIQQVSQSLPQTPFCRKDNWGNIDFHPFSTLSWYSWSVFYFMYDQSGSTCARTICELAGGAQTVDELDRIDPLFECLDCVHGERRLFMRWTNAIAHNATHRLSVTSYDDTIKSQVLREQGPHPRAHHWKKIARCSVCDPLDSETAYSDIRLHLREKHGIEDVKARALVFRYHGAI